MMHNARLLLGLFYEPSRAMSGILDRGSWIFGAVCVLAAGLAMSIPPSLIFGQLIFLAVALVPLHIAFATGIGGLGSFSTVLYRDYTPLLACTLMATAAASAPLIFIRFMVPFAALPMAVAAGLFFITLMVSAVQVVFGLNPARAIGVVVLALACSVAVGFAWTTFGLGLGYFASPFVLFYAYRYFSGDIEQIGRGLQTRQQFRQQLENATINPHDADAQFQLGLIYEQRRQYDEAVQRYRRAIEIDKSDPDPLFHLGRIERERGDVDAAYEHLSAAARLNPKHSLYEVQRELGAVAVDRKDWTNAHNLLAFYVDQRPYDPEGLYYLGFTLEQRGAQAEAHAIYTRAVEAVDTAPSNRRGMLRKWKSLAKEGLKRLP